MRVPFTIGTVLLLSALVSCNITVEHPAAGTCLCLTGTNVNAQSSAGLHTVVIAIVSQPSCYTFNGGVHASDTYTWYELQNVEGHNAWVAGQFLNISSDSQCITSSSGISACNDTTARDYACKLLHLAEAGTITLWKQHTSGIQDNAVAYNNIRDTCNGRAASRSHYPCHECRSPGAPGGHVCLSGTVLHYVLTLHDRIGYLHVNELAGECHTCTNQHYLGLAVDLHNPARQSSTMLSLCKRMGGSGRDDGNHIHCQFD